MDEDTREFLTAFKQLLKDYDVEVITMNGLSLCGYFGEYYIPDDKINTKLLTDLLK